MARLMVLSLAGVLVLSAFATAGPILSFTGGGADFTTITLTCGWEFNVEAASGVTVSALCLYDYGANGLVESHDVGIWNSSETLLTSVTIPAGTAAPLDVNGLFRVVDIPDVTLPAGDGYRIGAVYPGRGNSPGDIDNFALNVGLTVDPSISFVQARWIDSGLLTLVYPTRTNTQLDPGIFGPSFEIVVPEPASLLLLGTGALGLFGYIRRKKMK